MSRSRKKNPAGGMTVEESDKPGKVMEHRRERRQVKAALKCGEEDPPNNNYGNPWKMPKDGKQYWADHDDAYMRK